MITAMPRVAIAVRDMDEAVRHFRDVLGMPVHEYGWVVRELGIRMALCAPPGTSHIELMAPHQADRPQSRSLDRFLERRGEGLFAMMLYAPDPDRKAEELEQRGLPALPLMPEAGGRDLHPRDTAGVLIRIYPSAQDTDLESELDRHLGAANERQSELGLSGIRAVQIAVPDLDDAVAIYRDRLGLATEIAQGKQGSRTALFTPPDGSRIELHGPEDDDPEITSFLATGGRGLFALVIEADDFREAQRSLDERGVTIRETAAGSGEIDPSVTHGARIRFRGPRNTP